jgi:ABC-type glutathione transport system ATPase component
MARWPGDVLRATDVTRSFAGVHALRGVSLELHRHEVVGLIGPNGAGKTTLVNVLTGFDFPTAGAVELGGREITTWTPHRRGRIGLARTFQHSRSFARLSVRENVEVAALASGARPREARRRAAELLSLLGIDRHHAVEHVRSDWIRTGRNDSTGSRFIRTVFLFTLSLGTRAMELAGLEPATSWSRRGRGGPRRSCVGQARRRPRRASRRRRSRARPPRRRVSYGSSLLPTGLPRRSRDVIGRAPR